MTMQDLPLNGTCEADCRGASGWKAQFGRPHGWPGHVVGHLMAIKNRPMNRLAARVLEPGPEEALLEVGFGPGTLLEALARRGPRRLAGVEISETMLRQAARRNARAIREERLELRLASVSALPFEDASFTIVCAVNSFHHWPAPDRDLEEVRRVMAPGGRLCLVLRMEHPTRRRLVAPGYSEQGIERVVSRVRRAGFEHVHVEAHVAGREVRCLIAES